MGEFINLSKILKNRIKCNLCGDIIESKHVHDMETCSCGSCFVDGGQTYIRVGYNNPGDITDMAVYDDGEHETRRNNLRWGVNFTKNMDRLPKTEWRYIKDLNTDHIKAILDGGWCRDNMFYIEVFTDELKYREDNKIFE